MSEAAFEWSYFATIPSWLLRSQQISDGAKLFFCALTATCRESGECCKTNAQLAEELRCGERSVSRWVKELEGTGIISFRVSGAAQTGGNRERKIWLEWTPHRLAKIGETANIGETEPDRLAKIGETDLLNKNKKYTPIAPKKKETAPRELFLKYAGGDMDLLAALEGFAENREQLRKPISSARSVTLLTNKLDKLSQGRREFKIAMLNKAVEHNWQTVYALNREDLDDLAARTDVAPPVSRAASREEDQWLT